MTPWAAKRPKSTGVAGHVDCQRTVVSSVSPLLRALDPTARATALCEVSLRAVMVLRQDPGLHLCKFFLRQEP